MPVLNRALVLAPALLFLLFSCKKEVTEKQVYDNIIYQIDTAVLYNSAAEKNKQKSSTQYISILYSDLFSKSIPTNELAELAELSLALGDKSMVNELILSHYLKDPSVSLPTESQMRNDVESFVEDTYRIFYQRNPTPYEKIYLTEMINGDPDLTVPEIYIGFILSNEYYYY